MRDNILKVLNNVSSRSGVHSWMARSQEGWPKIAHTLSLARFNSHELNQSKCRAVIYITSVGIGHDFK